ncbi:MAG: phytanoyl-CoA dioxygenase family protein [Chitinophagales bacterium]|nr:phytanoyl-CoA dioxygenase family protein [Chitinophagales bacterium]
MIKTPGDNHVLLVHADWVYLDEQKHTCISLWIPAIDINEKNGTFGVIPQSHLCMKNLKKNGFFVVDLLDEQNLEKLRDIYKQHHLNMPQHFYSTSFLQDELQRKTISQEIQAIVRYKINLLLQNHQELGAVFLVKPSGENTAMPIHQDWIVAEEPEHYSITASILLHDTTVQNSAITDLPQSHKLSTGLRSPSLLDPLKDIKDTAATMIQTLEMKAGQAFIFSHALIHASHANQSENNRIAVAYGVLHQDTELVYYHKPSNGAKVQKLSIPKDFFISYPKPGEQPENSTLIKEFDYDEKAMGIDEFNQFYRLNQSTFLQKVKAWFN